MNRMWSVLIIPYLVDTVVPSTSGSRSRCTPWRDTSAPLVSWRVATLSISSMKTMPFCSALASARVLISCSLTNLPASSSVSSFIASAILSLRVRRLSCPNWLNMLRSCSVISSMPWGPMFSRCGRLSVTSISMSLSSSKPSRSFLRNICRVVLSAAGSAPSAPRGGGISTSRMRSSAGSSARGGTLFHLGLARLLDRHVGQVADDGVDILAHIAHLGELGGLDLDEGRIGQFGQAAGDLGLAHAGGAYHQDVLGRDLLAQTALHLLAAPAVAQRNRHGALGARLADDVLVELGDDLLGGHRSHGGFPGIGQRTGADESSACGYEKKSNLRPPARTRWRRSAMHSERFYRVVHVGVDAQFARNFQRLLDDVRRAQIGVVEQSLGGGVRIGAALANRDHALLGFEHIAIAGDDQRGLLIGHGQHGLEAAQHTVGAPILRQFDS